METETTTCKFCGGEITLTTYRTEESFFVGINPDTCPKSGKHNQRRV